MTIKQAIDQRKGDWMTTYTGRQFWPLDPRADEVCIEDIAHALSLTCRFGGHCREFYSVAQHSCLVADLVSHYEPTFFLAALLHDAAEAYVGDLIRPIKRTFEEFREIEARVMLAVCEKFKLGIGMHLCDVVKWADNALLKNEHFSLIQDNRAWVVDSMECPTIEIVPLSPSASKEAFLRSYEAATGEK